MSILRTNLRKAGLFGLAGGALGAGPAWFYDLVCAADGEGIFGDVAGDARRSGNVGGFAYADGCDQSAVAADEHSVFDDGSVLVNSIVVAGDGSGADVDAGADFGVAKISKVVGLRSLTQFDFFGLDKVADVRAFTNVATGAQMGVRSEDGTGADAGFFENASVTNE